MVRLSLPLSGAKGRIQGPLLPKGGRYLNKGLKVVKLSMKRYAVLLLLLAWPLLILEPHEGGGATPDGAAASIQGEPAPALNQNGSGPGSGPSLHSTHGQAQADGRPGGGDYEEADILEEGLPIMIEGGKASAVGSAESATPDKRGGGNPPQTEGHPGGKVSERKGE